MLTADPYDQSVLEPERDRTGSLEPKPDLDLVWPGTAGYGKKRIHIRVKTQVPGFNPGIIFPDMNPFFAGSG